MEVRKRASLSQSSSLNEKSSSATSLNEEETRSTKSNRHRLSKSSSNEKQATPDAPVARWKNFYTRFIAGLVMMAVFTGLIALGPFPVMLLIVAVQIAVFREVIAIAHLQSKERHLKWFRTIAWYFLFTTTYFLYGEGLIYYFKERVLVDALFLHLAQHHRFISFSAYIVGFVVFVLNLRKGHYKFQFSQLAFTHMILLFVVFQASFILCNIFEGLFWFVFPAALVICNDVMAYFFGFFFGRTRLIKLSPKKTWEGFWGALASTIIFGFLLSGVLAKIPYLVCPIKDLTQGFFNFTPCEAVNPVFIAKPYPLTPVLSALSYHLTGTKHRVVFIAPIQFHSILLGIFASVIGPFGGFFASGFKRAFKIKDFSDSIPGHGGVTDRVDCQFLMGLFSYVYLMSFIKVVKTSVGEVLQLAIDGLSTTDQVALYYRLKEYLQNQELI